MGDMLTISELARHAGVSVRTVRHYHQLGLLAEPERNALGRGRGVWGPGGACWRS